LQSKQLLYNILIVFLILLKNDEKNIVSSNSKCFSCCLYVIFLENKIFVRFPIISAYFVLDLILYLFPKFFSCFGTTSINLTVDEFFSISINSNPDSNKVFPLLHMYASLQFQQPQSFQNFLSHLNFLQKP